MANLLPQESLLEVWVKFRSRLILAIAFLLLFLAALAAGSLLPSYVSLIAPPSAQENEESQESALQRGALLRAQGIVNVISPVLTSTSSPSKAVNEAIELLPAGVSLSRISVDTKSGTMILTGGSPKRDAINEFRDLLLGSGRYRSVSVPVSALIGSQEGKFTITLSGSF